MLQVYHTPFSIILRKIRNSFTPKIEEESVQSQFTPVKDILQLLKWEPFQIFTFMNTLHLNFTEFYEKELKDHILRSYFQEVVNIWPQSDLSLIIF